MSVSSDSLDCCAICGDAEWPCSELVPRSSWRHPHPLGFIKCLDNIGQCHHLVIFHTLFVGQMVVKIVLRLTTTSSLSVNLYVVPYVTISNVRSSSFCENFEGGQEGRTAAGGQMNHTGHIDCLPTVA